MFVNGREDISLCRSTGSVAHHFFVSLDKKLVNALQDPVGSFGFMSKLFQGIINFAACLLRNTDRNAALTTFT